MTEIPTFKVYDSLNAAKERMGDLKRTVYSAASTTKAGTLTELKGAMALGGYQTYKPVVEAFDSAVDNMVKGFMANPYNITSVLTQNTGNYNAESFTYNKDEAAKDKGKILLKINPSTGLPTIDDSAPNYEKQKEEAETWVKNQFMVMLDNEQKKTTTSQISRQPETEGERNDRIDKQNASNIAQQIIDFATSKDKSIAGNAQVALDQYKIPVSKSKNILRVPIINSKGVYTGSTRDVNLNAPLEKIVREVASSIAVPLGQNENYFIQEGIRYGKGKSANIESDYNPLDNTAPSTEYNVTASGLPTNAASGATFVNKSGVGSKY
jgi:hypothetical protein